MSVAYKVVETNKGTWRLPYIDQADWAQGDTVAGLYVFTPSYTFWDLPENSKIFTIESNGNYLYKTTNYQSGVIKGVNVEYRLKNGTVLQTGRFTCRTDRPVSMDNFCVNTQGQVVGYTGVGYYTVGTATAVTAGLFGTVSVDSEGWVSHTETPEALEWINIWLEGAVEDDDDDPYNDPTAGEGDFDDGTSDDIDTPSLPTISAADTGFITLFNPSASQLKSLANYLWSDLFSLETLKKMFADPMSAILGLSILPIAVPTSGSRTVSVGNVSTGVSLPLVSSQFLEVNCGSVTVKRERPGTYLDYSPYTKVDLYLPFIGTHPLDVDEVMGTTINVKYHVDILSGACTAFVKCGGSILYQFIGSCAISVPITGNDWTNAINGVLNIAGSIGSMVLTGGATAPMAAGSIASTVTNSLKPNVEKTGAASGAGGLMGVKRPYLIISRPNRNVAKNQNRFIGYPTFKTKKLSALSGYNSILDVHLDNIPATQDEINEIRTLLKQGVIF